jgi:hypothetical protein
MFDGAYKVFGMPTLCLKDGREIQNTSLPETWITRGMTLTSWMLVKSVTALHAI